MKIKLSFAMLSLAILVLISVVSFAGATTLPTPMHGYIDFPASRPYLCSLGKNGDRKSVV